MEIRCRHVILCGDNPSHSSLCEINEMREIGEIRETRFTRFTFQGTPLRWVLGWGYVSNPTPHDSRKIEPSRSLSSRGAQDLAETVIIHVTSRKETDMRFRVTPEVTLNLLCNPRDLSGVVPNRARMPLTPSVARHTGLDSPSPCHDAR